MSRLLAWIKKESHAEKLIAKALIDFEAGDVKTALGDLVEGLLEMADGTKAEPALFNLQTRLANFNIINQPDRPTAGIPTTPLTTK